MNDSNFQLYVSHLVLQETGTVLNHRVGPAAVQLFRENFPELEALEIRLDESLEEKSWKLFVDQTKKGCSFVDCSNIILCKEFLLDKIISFDSFYPKKLHF